MSNRKQLFLVPADADGAGIFIGGGFHNFESVKDGEGNDVRVVCLPARGDWSALARLGYRAAPASLVPLEAPAEGVAETGDQ